jgi:hypothetical protein
MKDVFSILRRELDHLLHAIGHLNTDHGIHGYAPTASRTEEGTNR